MTNFQRAIVILISIAIAPMVIASSVPLVAGLYYGFKAVMRTH